MTINSTPATERASDQTDTEFAAPETEFLLAYIALKLDSADEESALGVWLAAVDAALEEARFADAQRLLAVIRSYRLSARAQGEVSLARAE